MYSNEDKYCIELISENGDQYLRTEPMTAEMALKAAERYLNEFQDISIAIQRIRETD